MTTTIDIWSDIHCPWAYVAVHRLRRARDAHGLDVVFAPRAWPLEWVNRRGTPRDILTTETAVLASHEPGLFTADVAGDFLASGGLPIQGSPQIFWPDGSTTHNPGIADHRWHGGLVHIGHTEPGEAEQLLLTRIAGSRD